MVSVSKDSGAEFFESARLARTKARDEALDTLKKSLKDAKLSDAEEKKADRGPGRASKQHHS